MSGTGQKHELKQMMVNLHQMLKLMGQNDGSKMIIKFDQFQCLRIQFSKAAQQYQKANNSLSSTPDKKQRGILLYLISSNRQVMDYNLKQMMTICLRASQKNKQKKRKTKKQQQEFVKLQNQLQYKNLTLYQLQNIYFKLTNRQHKDAANKNNQYFPDQITLDQLKLRKPLKRGYSQTSDPQSQQYLQQQQILQTIKHIDQRIQQKMVYILEGIKLLNHNAVTISQSIGVVHNKILVNVEKLQQNLNQLQGGKQLLRKANNVVSKPSCILNIIIIVLLGIIVYFLVRKAMQ